MARRTRIFIDWLSVTVGVESDLHESISLYLNGLCEAGLARVDRTHANIQRYRYAFEIDLEGGRKAYIQIAPREASAASGRAARRFLRLEVNPNTANGAWGEAMTYLWGHISAMLGGCTRAVFYQNAQLTRIDLSFDLYEQISLYDVRTILRRVVSSRWRYEGTGELSGISLGSSGSDRYLNVYDKRLERYMATPVTQRREALTYQIVGARMHRFRPITRFELRLRRLAYMSDFGGIRNPFEDYTVRRLEMTSDTIPRYVRDFFMDSVRQRGVQAALSLIDDRRTRRRFSNAFDLQDPPEWWDVTQLWAEAQAAVSRLF